MRLSYHWNREYDESDHVSFMSDELLTQDSIGWPAVLDAMGDGFQLPFWFKGKLFFVLNELGLIKELRSRGSLAQSK